MVIGQQNNSWLKRRRQQRGVTLVELLVVMMIMAMVAGVVIISAPPPTSDLRKTADRFAARLDHAVGYSITSSTPMALEIDATGYHFKQYTDGVWSAPLGKSLRPVMFEPNLLVELIKPETDQRSSGARLSEPKTQTVIFSPTGETGSFEVRFHQDREFIDVVMNDQGNIMVTANDAR